MEAPSSLSRSASPSEIALELSTRSTAQMLSHEHLWEGKQPRIIQGAWPMIFLSFSPSAGCFLAKMPLELGSERLTLKNDSWWQTIDAVGGVSFAPMRKHVHDCCCNGVFCFVSFSRAKQKTPLPSGDEIFKWVFDCVTSNKGEKIDISREIYGLSSALKETSEFKLVFIRQRCTPKSDTIMTL